ncbi:MAG TPA: amino acid permease [Planctomycetota bacterium]|nr:amino acid permease [Planctomycetota bacterium]
MSREGSGAGLVRALGPFDAMMIVMGSIIGAGVFQAPSRIALEVPSLGGILFLWGLGGVIALCGALVFAELGGMLPRAGGEYVFLREGFGRFVAFLFGWILITAIVSPAIAYVAGVFVDHLQALLRRALPALAFGDGPRPWIATLLILALTGLNVRGVKLGARIQNASMIAKIAGMVLIVALGAAVASGLEPRVEPVAAPSRELSLSGFGAALLGVVFAYGGWQNVAAVAGEIRRPERALPLAILAGTALVVALYVALNASLIAILGVGGVAASPTPVASAAGAVMPGGEQVVAALVMLSTFAITQVLLMVTPRIYYAMARDGVFFASAGWVHPRWRTPAVAILFQGLCSVAYVWRRAAFDTAALDSLLDATVIADWTFFALCGLALFVLRRRRPEAPRPYRAFGYPWLPGLFVLCSIGIVVNSLFNADRAAALGYAVLLGAGVCLYALWSRGARPAP